MANGEGRAWEFTEHPVVAALVRDPRAVPRLTLHAGLPGNGPDGKRRIYVSPVLDEYVDVDAEDVLYTHQWPGDIRHLVWIREGAKVTHVTTREESAAHRFLTGPITTTYCSAAGGAHPHPPPTYAPTTHAPTTHAPPSCPPPYGWPGKQPGELGDWTASNCRHCPSSP